MSFVVTTYKEVPLIQTFVATCCGFFAKLHEGISVSSSKFKLCTKKNNFE